MLALTYPPFKKIPARLAFAAVFSGTLQRSFRIKTKAAPYGRQSFTNHSEDVTNTLKEWVESIRTAGAVQAFCSAC